MSPMVFYYSRSIPFNIHLEAIRQFQKFQPIQFILDFFISTSVAQGNGEKFKSNVRSHELPVITKRGKEFRREYRSQKFVSCIAISFISVAYFPTIYPRSTPKISFPDTIETVDNDMIHFI